MSKLMIALFSAAGLGFAGSAFADMPPPNSMSTPMSKEGYIQAKKNADAQYQIDRDACSSLSGNAKGICAAEATGKKIVSKAEADAAYKNTPKARENARLANAQANYHVAIQKCDELAGNRKDVCEKESKAEFVKASSEARAERVSGDSRQDAATKQADARKEGNADRRDAQYDVAIAKCDALAGPSKDACVASAKVQYGKS